MTPHKFLSALVVSGIAIAAVLKVDAAITEFAVRATLQRSFPTREVRVEPFRRASGRVLCGSALIDRYGYRVYAVRNGLATATWLQPHNEDDPDLIIRRPTEAQRRFWMHVKSGCDRSGAGPIGTMTKAVVEGARAPWGSLQLVEIGGRRFAIPAGNWDRKVSPKDGKIITSEDHLILRGETPAWDEAPLFPTPTGWGSRIYDLVIKHNKTELEAYEGLRDLIINHAENLGETLLAGGERKILMKHREGHFVSFRSLEADVFIDDRRRRFTVCTRHTARHLNDSCSTTIINDGLWHKVSYGIAYKDQRHRVADTLLAKMSGWERAATEGGYRYVPPPDVVRANWQQRQFEWMVR